LKPRAEWGDFQLPNESDIKTKEAFLRDANKIAELQKEFDEYDPENQKEIIQKQDLKKELEDQIGALGINYKSFVFFFF